MFLPAAPRPNYFLTPAIKGSEPAVELLEPAAYNRKTSPARPARVIKTARVGVQTSLSSSSPISFLSFALQSPRHFALCPRFLRRCSSTPFRVFSFSFFFFELDFASLLPVLSSDSGLSDDTFFFHGRVFGSWRVKELSLVERVNLRILKQLQSR